MRRSTEIALVCATLMLTCAMPRTSFAQEVASVIQVQDAPAAPPPAAPPPAPAPVPMPKAKQPVPEPGVPGSESSVTPAPEPVPASPGLVPQPNGPSPTVPAINQPPVAPGSSLLPASSGAEAFSFRQETEGLRTRGERQRLAGILLLATGIGLGAGGGVVLSRCCNMPVNTSTFTDPSQVQPLVDDARNQVILGGVLTGLGIGAVVTGLSLVGVGQSNINAARRLGRSLALISAPAGSLGAGLRLGF